MTKFSFEVPIPHLDDFNEDQDFLFTLSFLYDDERYNHYFIKKFEEGAEIWLDNSYNEKLEADGYTDLIQIGRRVAPRFIICPDDPKWTEEQIAYSFNVMRRQFSEERLMVVVNSFEMYQFMVNAGAKVFSTSYWNRPFPDLKFIPRHHFLGLRSVQELIDHEPPTCDTGMPIKLAIMNTTIDTWIRQGCPHIYSHEMGMQGSDYFNYKMTVKEINLAKLNIIALRRIVDEKE